MARILVILMGVLLLSCVVCAGLGYFYFIPKAQDQVEENLQEAVSTYVVPYFAGLELTPEAGTYTLSAQDVNAAIASSSISLDDLTLQITPAGLTWTFGDQGQNITYTANVLATDGKFEIVDADLDGVPGWLVPEGSITDALESALNGYLSENGLVLTDVELTDGAMTITTADV